MRFGNSLLCTSALAVGATAYIFPKDLPNGNYSVFVKDGQEWHVHLDSEPGVKLDPNPAASYAFPEDLADGAYSVVISSGTDVSVNLEEPTATPHRDLSSSMSGTKSFRARDNSKRQQWWPSGTYVTCGNDYLWASHFYDSGGAWEKFWQTCTYSPSSTGHQVKWEENWTAGSYLCSYHSYYSPSGAWGTTFWQSNCAQAEWVDAVNWIGYACTGGGNGWKQSGKLNVPGWDKSYGFTNKDARWNQC